MAKLYGKEMTRRYHFTGSLPGYRLGILSGVSVCFYHDFAVDAEGYVSARLLNPNRGEKGLMVYIRYKKEELPYFCEWKQLGEQEYVMGLIPANSYAEGRHAARENHELMYMNPGERKEVTLELGCTP